MQRGVSLGGRHFSAENIIFSEVLTSLEIYCHYQDQFISLLSAFTIRRGEVLAQ